jgi:hypothetical protein
MGRMLLSGCKFSQSYPFSANSSGKFEGDCFRPTGRYRRLFSTVFTPAIGTDRPVFPLHGQMKQEDRERSLGDLRIVSNTVLIATDVAARGTQLLDHFCELFRHDRHFNGNRPWSERIDGFWLRTML